MVAALVALVALVALIACGGCGVGARGPGIDVERALAFVHSFSTPRPAQTPEVEAAARRIEGELVAAGVTVHRVPVGTVEVPAITVLGATYRRAHRVSVPEPNLVVRFGPPGPALLLMAHYDSVEYSPGATDNAVAVAVLIEIARGLARDPPPQPVRIVFTAAEEIGLVGAEKLAATIGEDTSFAIALDLLGGDGDLIVNGASTLIGRAELRWIAEAAGAAGVEINVPPVHRVISRWWPQAERSDHGPFTRRGVRAIHLYNRGNDGEYIDLAYHSGRDVPERVRRASVDELGRLLHALIERPVPAHVGDAFWIPWTHVVIPRGMLVLALIGLVVIVIVNLVLSRDGLVAHLTQERRGMTRGPALLVGVLCYGVALIAAFGAERLLPSEHAQPWLHDPARAQLVIAAALAGTLGLVTRGVARIAPWRGDYRYLVVAIVMHAFVGIALLAIGAAELAWVWLVPAALLALAPRLARDARPTRGVDLRAAIARLDVLAIPIAAVPLVAVLDPSLLREAAWNGFLPVSLPLSLLVGLFGIPVAATTAWWLRRRIPAGPMGTLVLGLGCVLLVVLGFVVALRTSLPCTAAEFGVFHLGCERV